MSLGDSITQGGTWQGAVAAKHGLVLTNLGIGGTQLSGTQTEAFWQDVRVNAIPLDATLVTIMGGTNDWAQNRVLGTRSDTDPTATFWGGWNVLIDKIHARVPAAVIMIMTTPYGEIPNWEVRSGWTSPAHNALGYDTNDYAEICREVAKYRNCALVDVARDAGWGTENIDLWIDPGEETDDLHPLAGSLSARGISRVLNGRLTELDYVV